MESPENTSLKKTKSTHRRRWWVKTLYGLFGLVVVAILVLVVTLQTDWGRDKVIAFAEDQVAGLLVGARLEIGSLDGSLLWSARAHEVRLFAGDSLVASIDEVEADYNLLKLPFGTLDIGDVRVGGPRILTRQLADSTWDLLGVLPPSDPDSEPSDPLRITVNHIRVTEGSGEARFLSGADSLVGIDSVNASLSDLRVAYGVEIDSFAVHAVGYGSVLVDPVRLNLKGSFGDDRFACQQCSLVSSRSFLGIDGSVDFGDKSRRRYADIKLDADSLALADLKPFLPFVNGSEIISGNGFVFGPIDSLAMRSDLSWSRSRVAIEGLIVQRDSVMIHIDAGLDAVDPSDLWGGSPLYGALNADFQTQLHGPVLNRLNGQASLTTSESVLNQFELRDSDLHVEMDDGIASISGNLSVPGVNVDLKGQFTPFGDTLYWDLEGTAHGRDFGDAYPSVRDLESFSLRYRAEGSSAAPADYFRNLDVDLDQVTYADFLVDSTRLRFDLTDGGVAVHGSGRLASASTGATTAGLDLAGRIDFPEETVLTVDRLTLLNLDLGFGGDPSNPVSRLNATASGRIDIPPEGDLSATFEVGAHGRILSVETLDLDASGHLAGDDLDVEAQGFVDSAFASVSGQIQPFRDDIPFSAIGRFERIDFAGLTADSSMRSNLNGSLEGRGAWTSASNNRLRLDLSLQKSSWNEQPVTEGSIRFGTDDGSFDFDTRIETPGGGMELEGDGLWSADTLAIRRLDGTFSRINVGNILDVDRLDTDLNGEIQLDPARDGFSGIVEMHSSRINRSQINTGRFEVSLVLDTLKVDGSANFRTGRLEFAGDLQANSGGTFIQTVFEIDSLDVAALAGIDSLDSSVNAGCSLAGTISTLADTDVSGLCLAENSRYDGVTVRSARIEADLDRQVLKLDTLTIHSNIAGIEGSGIAWFGPRRRMDSPRALSDLNITAQINDLAPLGRPLGLTALAGEGTIDISVTGRPGSPNIAVEPHLAFLTYDDVRVSSIDGYVETDGLELTDAQAVIDIGFSVIGGYPIQQSSISLLADPESVIFTSDIVQRQGRRGNISATYLRSLETPELRIEDLTINVAGTIWRLNQEATVRFGDTWEIEQFLLAHETGQIAVDGHVDPNGEQSLVLTAESVETASFIDLLGFTNVSGSLEGFLILEGPADSLMAQASFRVRDLASRGIPAGDLRVEMEYNQGRLNLDGSVQHLSGNDAQISGSVPVSLNLSGERTVLESDPIDLSVKADSLPVSWLLPFLDQSLISDIGGILHSEFSIGGSWDDPRLAGSGTWTHGLVGLPDFGTEINEIDARFSLQDDVLTLDRFAARTGTGTIAGKGIVDVESLSDLGLDLHLKFQDFKAIATETYRFTLSGSAEVTGSLRSPVVSADVLLGPGDVYMTDELLADEMEAVALNTRDLRVLERRFGYQVAASDTTTSDFVEALKLDADVSIGRDVWLRSSANPAMDIEFSGDLDVRKEPFQDYRIVGRINVNPARSRIIQFARRFGVDRGTITFNGPIEDAVLDFRAEYKVPSRFGGDEVRILLSLTGLMEDLQLDISSQPQMDDATIASYLLTGRPPDKATVAGEQAAEIAIGGVSRLVEAFANENFGLDVVEIEPSGVDGAQFTVGKYISPRTYIYVKQPLAIGDNAYSSNGNRGTQLGLEYELYSWLISEVSSRNGNFRLNLRWQISY